MKVTVEIYGSLRQYVPEYDADQGLEVDLPASARLKDHDFAAAIELLRRADSPEALIAAATAEAEARAATAGSAGGR